VEYFNSTESAVEVTRMSCTVKQVGRGWPICNNSPCFAWKGWWKSWNSHQVTHFPVWALCCSPPKCKSDI